MNLIQCLLTDSYWYEKSAWGAKPVGILWHDTSAGNKYIKRYVQPADDDPNHDALIEIIGKNVNGNDWNHVTRKAGVHAFIGTIADGSIATVQSGEYDLHPMGCGSGENGSCNGYAPNDSGVMKYVPETWLQFEIQDDGFTKGKYTGTEEYFDAVYKEACEYTAYLCRKFNIDPHGTVDFYGVEVPTILCHKDSCDLGLGSDHKDVLLWFEKYGKTMDDVRNDVAALLKPELELLDVVKIKDGVTTYANGKKIASWVLKSELYVRAINDDKVTVSIYDEGDITGTVWKEDLELIRKHTEVMWAPKENLCSVIWKRIKNFFEHLFKK